MAGEEMKGQGKSTCNLLCLFGRQLCSLSHCLHQGTSSPRSEKTSDPLSPTNPAYDSVCGTHLSSICTHKKGREREIFLFYIKRIHLRIIKKFYFTKLACQIFRIKAGLVRIQQLAVFKADPLLLFFLVFTVYFYRIIQFIF